jgi:hypothetical protein
MSTGARRIALRSVIAILGLGLLIIGDQAVRAMSLSRIVTISEDIQEALISYRDQRVALDDYMNENVSTLADPREFYTSRIALMAEDALPPLGYSYDALQRVVVLPWHDRVVLARAVMTDHTDAWAGELDSYVQDPENVFRRPYNSAINATWFLLGKSFEEAIPPIEFFDLQARIDDFVDEGQSDPRN